MTHTLSRQNFHYDLPLTQIAQTPAPRGDSRLLVYTPHEPCVDKTVADLPLLIPSNSLMIFNDTKVFASRIYGRTSLGEQVEVFILKVKTESNKIICEAIGKPRKKIIQSAFIEFPQLRGMVREYSEDIFELAFAYIEEHIFYAWLEKFGRVPLPPYIKREGAKPFFLSDDASSYQTVYASHTGSVAAPTAGLHFSHELLVLLQEKAITCAFVTLHVGLGTFMPVKVDDLKQHQMHEELFCLPGRTLEAILKAKKTGNKIIVVGTTSLRCLEGFYQKFGDDSATLHAHTDKWLTTDVFIYPETATDRHQPWACDGLITNFHQPYSTLLMLVSALVGYHETRKIYSKALENKYRFLSYGDASLLWLRG